MLWVLLFFTLILVPSCEEKDTESLSWPEGTYNQSALQKLTGFSEQRAALLLSESMTIHEFIQFSTDSAWHLSETNRTRLKQLRDRINFPSASTVMEKVIPLEEVALYMNNTYGGTVGGFVSAAGDVKMLKTLYEIYYGTRLDYPGTKFRPDGAGYAVIRYTSNATEHLLIPYCVEMGGTRSHAWPNTGGGFTASTLGDGGFPEYVFSGYYAPNQGGEIYEVTPAGNEILRSTYNGTGWVTVEPETKGTPVVQVKNPIRNGMYTRWKTGEYYPVSGLPGGRWVIKTDLETFSIQPESLVSIQTFGNYRGYTFLIRGYDGENYYLVNTDPEIRNELSLEVIEKGIYGLRVPVSEVKEIREITARQYTLWSRQPENYTLR
jgi:hypothetical protein